MEQKSYFVLLLFLFCQIATGQILKKETLSSQGSSHFVYANNKSYYILESIGQGSVIQTFNASNYSLRQGFLQPVSASALTSSVDSNLEATIYPNPFTTQVTIQFNEPVLDELNVSLYDVLGRLIFEKTYQPNQQITITMNSVVSGQYLLYVKMRSQVLKAKLIKN